MKYGDSAEFHPYLTFSLVQIRLHRSQKSQVAVFSYYGFRLTFGPTNYNKVVVTVIICYQRFAHSTKPCMGPQDAKQRYI